MAGKSHNHTMNIGIKVESSGVGKTNSELLQLTQEAKGLDGKKISLQVDLGDKASKSIDSIVSGIGNMEKAMNSISSKGIDGIQDAVSGAAKSIDTLSSSIGSLQSSLDSISAKGIQDISSEMGSVSKNGADAASGVGQLSTAVQTVNIGNIQELASALGQVQTQANDAASAVSKAMQTSGFTDNWNNSYGGRYGGMRYTGQGKGISDLVSFIGGGKSSYDLTVENAMNKTRNMAVAKSWTPDADISGMDAYWALDTATNHSLMSLNTLAAGINATAATTGASAKDIEKHAQDFADFGTMVMGLGYTEDVAQTAVMKLGRGLHGTFAALDQYGITKESLTNTGLWSGDEKDLDGYMAAVSHYSQAMSKQLMNTPSGTMATLSKSASLGGYSLGALESELMSGIVGKYKKADDDFRTWSKKSNIPLLSGADVVDNKGQKVLEKESGRYMDTNRSGKLGDTVNGVSDEPIMESLYVDPMGNVVDDLDRIIYKSDEAEGGLSGLQKAMNEGFKQKKTGVGLSTFIIAADQGIKAYKTLKDTILGTYAEWRDLKRMRKVGLKNLFKDDSGYDYYNGYFHKVGQGMDETCKKIGDGCPNADKKGSGKKDAGKSKQKKKKGRLGRWKDKLLGRVDDSENQINKDISQLGKQKPAKKDFSPLLKKRDRDRRKFYGNKYTTDTGDYNLGHATKGMGFLNDLARREKYNKHGLIEDTVPKMNTGTIKESRGAKPKSNAITYGNRRNFGRQKTGYNSPKTASDKNYKRLTEHERRIGGLGRRSDLPNMGGGRVIPESKIDKLSRRNGVKDARKSRSHLLNESNLQNKLGGKVRKIGLLRDAKKDSIGNAINNKNLGNFFSNDFQKNAADAYKRNQYMNKYGGYQKRTLGAIYDTRKLKNKAKNYIGDRKNLIKDEYGSLKKEAGRQSKKIQKMPKKALDGLSKNMKNQMSLAGNKLSNSFLGNQYGALQRQGDAAKNMIANSPMINKVKGKAKGAKNSLWGQIKGNASSIGNMTGITPWFNNLMGRNGGDSGGDDDDDGKKGKGKGDSDSDGDGKKGKGKKKGFGAKVKSGLSGVTGAVGKLKGGMGSLIGKFASLGGEVGMVIGVFAMLAAGLEAIGIDLVTPLQTMWSGAMEAFKPVIDGINTWMAGYAEKMAPYITQIAEQIAPLLTELGDAIGPLIMDAMPVIAGGLVEAIKAITPVLKGIGDMWNQLNSGDNSGFIDTLKRAVEIALQLNPLFGPIIASFRIMSWVWDNINGGATQFGDILKTAGDIINGIIEDLKAVWDFFSSLGGLLNFGSPTTPTPEGSFGDSGGGTFGETAQPQSGGSGGLFGQQNNTQMGQPALQSQAVQQMNADLDAINAKIANVNQQITTMMTTFNTSFQSLTTTLMTLTTMVITSILTIMTTIITLATTGFMMLGMVVTSTLTTILAALFAFSGQAISIMTLTATGMVTGFTGSFHGIAEAVSNEMSGAYDALCMWGDRMVEKARQIGADIRNALTGLGMGINSPGYIWNDIKGEFVGVYGEITGQGKRIVSAAKMVGTNIVRGYNNGYGSTPLAILDRLTTSSSKVPVETEIPTQNLPLQNLVSPPLPTQDALVSPPTVKPPRLVKDMAAVQDMPQQQTFNFNHYGDIDNEERSNKVLKAIASRMGFENKRAGRTVNKPRPAGG